MKPFRLKELYSRPYSVMTIKELVDALDRYEKLRKLGKRPLTHEEEMELTQLENIQIKLCEYED